MATPVPTPMVPEHFDYAGAARAAGLSDGQLASLRRLFEAEYPNDLMLRELHILRACHAIHSGLARLDDMLAATPPASAA